MSTVFPWKPPKSFSRVLGAIIVIGIFTLCCGKDESHVGGATADELNENGWSSYSLGDLEGAASYFADALQLDEGFSEARLGLGWCAAKVGQYQAALDHFEAVVEFGDFAVDGFAGRAAAALGIHDNLLVIASAESVLARRLYYSFHRDEEFDWGDVRLMLAQAFVVTSQYSDAQEQVDLLNPSNGLDVGYPGTWVVEEVAYATYEAALIMEIERLWSLIGEKVLPCIPMLVSPLEEAELDNGCAFSSELLSWNFDWVDCPDASRYHLYVYHPRTGEVAINDSTIESSSHLYECNGCNYPEGSDTGWRWKVRARTASGVWGAWSGERSFRLEASGRDCELCVPRLVSPLDGAIMDNGCSDRSDPQTWYFDWEDCGRATVYHLYVYGPGALDPAIDKSDIKSSDYSDHCADCYVANPSRLGWRWRVRAKTGGEWGVWSVERVFDVEPLDTDCPSD